MNQAILDHNKIEFSKMDSYGDTKMIWDKSKPEEIEAARSTFNSLVKDKKYLAFKCTSADGNKGDQIREFDPSLSSYILVPPMVGG